LRVDLIESIQKFAQVRYSSNGITAFVYASDLKKAPATATQAAPSSDIIRVVSKLKWANSLLPSKEVLLTEGKPTVHLLFLAGKDTEIELSVVKETLKPGFKATINRQGQSGISLSVKHGKDSRGIGGTDYLTFEVLERDDERKTLGVRLGGSWGGYGRNSNATLKVEPSTVRITGPQFIETVRPHTAKELGHVFKMRDSILDYRRPDFDTKKSKS
jgi:hypothetical protein